MLNIFPTQTLTFSHVSLTCNATFTLFGLTYTCKAIFLLVCYAPIVWALSPHVIPLLRLWLEFTMHIKFTANLFLIMVIADYLQFSSEYETLHCYTFRTILVKEENNLNNANTLWMYQRSTLYMRKSFLHPL